MAKGIFWNLDKQRPFNNQQNLMLRRRTLLQYVWNTFCTTLDEGMYSTYVWSLRIRSVKLSPPEERNNRLRISICFNPYCTTSITSWPVLHSTIRAKQFTISSWLKTLNIMATIPRVSSTASELNDFQETKEGEKIYNVSVVIHNSIHAVLCDLCS